MDVNVRQVNKSDGCKRYAGNDGCERYSKQATPKIFNVKVFHLTKLNDTFNFICPDVFHILYKVFIL
jgi:hypothetical protein